MWYVKTHKWHVKGTARINGISKDFDLIVYVDSRGICEEKILAEVIKRLGGNVEIISKHIDYVGY